MNDIKKYINLKQQPIDFKIDFNTYIIEIYVNGDEKNTIAINLETEAKAKQIEKALLRGE